MTAGHSARLRRGLVRGPEAADVGPDLGAQGVDDLSEVVQVVKDASHEHLLIGMAASAGS